MTRPATTASTAVAYLLASVALATILVPVMERPASRERSPSSFVDRWGPALGFAASLAALAGWLGLPPWQGVACAGLLAAHLLALRGFDRLLHAARVGVAARALLTAAASLLGMLAPILAGGILDSVEGEVTRERLARVLLLLHPAPAALGSIAGIDWLRSGGLYPIGTLARFYPFRYPSPAAAAAAGLVAALALTCAAILLSRLRAGRAS